jgi:hypothetical protein
MDAEHSASMLDNLNAGLEQVKLTAIVQTLAGTTYLLRLIEQARGLNNIATLYTDLAAILCRQHVNNITPAFTGFQFQPTDQHPVACRRPPLTQAYCLRD